MAAKTEKQAVANNRHNVPWADPNVREEMLLEIIGRIAEGESLTRICLEKEKGYCSPATFLFWIGKNPILAKHYARAIEIRSDINVEMIVDIADTEANVAKARNMMDARKYHNEKLAPKKYGAKVFAESNTNIDIKQKIDLTMIPAQVREQLRSALMKQIELTANSDDA